MKQLLRENECLILRLSKELNRLNQQIKMKTNIKSRIARSIINSNLLKGVEMNKKIIKFQLNMNLK